MLKCLFAVYFRKPLNVKKSVKDKYNRTVCKMADRNPKGFIDEVLGDVSKSSASKQLLLGASSGWYIRNTIFSTLICNLSCSLRLTGFVAMQFGKVLGTALGGGIILLELANEKGYIKINWDKVNRKLDKVSDKVEKNITGQGPSWSDKVGANNKTLKFQ